MPKKNSLLCEDLNFLEHESQQKEVDPERELLYAAGERKKKSSVLRNIDAEMVRVKTDPMEQFSLEASSRQP